LEEGDGKPFIRFDIDETGSSDISQGIMDIDLKDNMSFFIDCQSQLGQRGNGLPGG